MNIADEDTTAKPRSFSFSHAELRRPGSYFMRGENREVTLALQFGELKGALSLDALVNSLNLPPTHPDRQLLELVSPALNYMRSIQVGSPVPSELLDGRPSWMPKEHVVQRGAVTLWRALQLPLLDAAPQAELPPPGSDAEKLHQIARLVKLLLPDLAVEMIERRMRDVIVDIARVDWLRRMTSALQRTVGEMAQFSARHNADPAGDLARRGALQLRQVAIWGTERAMICDAVVADVNRLLVEADHARQRVWPQINLLRAFALDIEAVLARWNQAQMRSDGPRLRDLEDLLRLVSQRYAAFDPEIFMPPKRRPAGKREYDA